MLRIIQFTRADGPGEIPAVLSALGQEFQVVPATSLCEVEQRPGDALVLLGAPGSVNDGSDCTRAAMCAVKVALSLELPLIGHCFGGQLIAHALGARVDRCPLPEIGWVDIVTLPAAADLIATPMHFKSIGWHSEGFDLPAGATALWEGATWRQQGFAYGNALAMQFHPEARQTETDTWATNNPHTFARASPHIQSPPSINAGWAANGKNQRRLLHAIYTTWFDETGR